MFTLITLRILLELRSSSFIICLFDGTPILER